MSVEIERKFLVIGDEWRSHSEPHPIVQGYLSRDPDRVVRVRLIDGQAFMTVKGRPVGITRSEIEFPIDPSHALALLPMCIPTVIDKTRHYSTWAGFTWEIDEFHGANDGLIIAEIELPSEDALFECPPWIGREVSSDHRYANSYLSEHPFKSW